MRDEVNAWTISVAALVLSACTEPPTKSAQQLPIHSSAPTEEGLRVAAPQLAPVVPPPVAAPTVDPTHPTAAPLAAEPSGRVCVARLDAGASPGKGASGGDYEPPEPARMRRQLARGVDVLVDDRHLVHVDAGKGSAEIPGLTLAGSHSVVVKDPSGERLAGFTFTFAQYESDVVCIYDNSFYATWRIKRADKRDRCHCTDQPRRLRKRGGLLVL